MKGKPLCLPGRGMVHRWRYEEPSGPTVTGVCRYCGAVDTGETVPMEAGNWGEWYGLPGSKPWEAEEAVASRGMPG